MLRICVMSVYSPKNLPFLVNLAQCVFDFMWRCEGCSSADLQQCMPVRNVCMPVRSMMQSVTRHTSFF